jgi:SAM-dependent methyltransferase
VISVGTTRPVASPERWGWRSLFLAAGHDIEFLQSSESCNWIRADSRRIVLPASDDTDPVRVAMQEVWVLGRSYRLAVPTGRQLTLAASKTEVRLGADPFRACIAWLVLLHERGLLPLDDNGAIAARCLPRWRDDPESGVGDCLLDTVRFACGLLCLPRPEPLLPVFGRAPYGIVVSLDWDCAEVGTEAVLAAIGDLGLPAATVFLPGSEPTDSTRLCSRLAAMGVEVGLLSQVGTRCADGDVTESLRRRRRLLEDARGAEVVGHRSPEGRAVYPALWGHAIRAGFRYDASLSYRDVAGQRNGTALPVLVPDPGGDGGHIWTLGPGLTDLTVASHTLLDWGAVQRTLDDLRQTRSLLTLNWRASCFASGRSAAVEIFNSLVAHATSDGAWIGTIRDLVDGYSSTSLARQLATRHLIEIDPLRGTAPIGGGDHSHYRELANAAVAKVAGYVDATVASFLGLLPEDAETIVDVGCGHGWVSNQIPEFRQVVCIDMAEETMRHVCRRKALGSIAALPLPDQSVDLTLATDVIEHLDEAELERAWIELDRAARKYIYLQCPNAEDLPLSQAVCKTCRHVWHVVAHLRSVDTLFLADQARAGWALQAIVCTGDVRYSLTPRSDEIGLGTRIPVYSYSPGPLQCPRCGSSSTFGPDELSSFLASRQPRRPVGASRLSMPQFSEIGVLLTRDPANTPDEAVHVLVRGAKRALASPRRVFGNVIDFRDPIKVTAHLDKHSPLPQLSLANCALRQCRQGGEVCGSALSKSKSITVCFADGSNAEWLEINGWLTAPIAENSSIGINILDEELRERLGETQVDLRPGPFVMRIRLPFANAAGAVLHFPCDLNAGLEQIALDDRGLQYLCYDFRPDEIYSHVVLRRNGVEMRWIIPPEQSLITSAPIDALMEEGLAAVVGNGRMRPTAVDSQGRGATADGGGDGDQLLAVPGAPVRRALPGLEPAGGAAALAAAAGNGPPADVLVTWLAFAAGSRGKEIGQEWWASVHAALGGTTVTAATAGNGPPADVLVTWLAFAAGSRGKEIDQEWWASVHAALGGAAATAAAAGNGPPAEVLEASRQRVAAQWLVRPAIWILRRSRRFYIQQEQHFPFWFKKRIKTAARFIIRRFRIAV